MGNCRVLYVYISSSFLVIFVYYSGMSFAAPPLKSEVKMKSNYATESQIDDAPAGTKLNFGGNLYMRVSKGGEKVFHFRVCLDGKDTTHSIGKLSPDLKFSDARRIADQRQSEVAQARTENIVGAFRARLKSPTKRQVSNRAKSLSAKAVKEGGGFAGFRSLEDAGRFLDGLWRAKDSLPDLYFWLRLTFYIPSRSNHLLNAMWNDFDLENGTWTIRMQRPRLGNINEPVRHLAVLSEQAKQGLGRLRETTGADDFLFPNLRRMSAASQRREVRKAMERVWPQYFVDPDEFAAFFECVAKKYSLFHPDLVEGMLVQRPGSPADYNHGTYFMQLRSLANWWGGTLDWFGDVGSNVPWGGTWVPLQPDSGRPKWRR